MFAYEIRMLAVGAFALLLTTSALSATYYVSPDGDDANTGAAPEPTQALGTIRAGVDNLQPGDTVLIRGGVYRETVTFARSGEAARPIAVRPYDNEEAPSPAATRSRAGCAIPTRSGKRPCRARWGSGGTRSSSMAR